MMYQLLLGMSLAAFGGWFLIHPVLAATSSSANELGQCCYAVMQQLPVSATCQTLSVDRNLCINSAMDYSAQVVPLGFWGLLWAQGLSVLAIGAVCLILVGLILLLKFWKKYHLRVIDYVMSMLLGSAATAASLIYHMKRFSGEGQIEQFGWPHFFYFMYYDLNNVIQDQGINFGPVGSYLIMNILFYSLAILLVIILFRLLTRQKKSKRYLS